MGLSLRSTFPLRILVGNEDVTQYIDEATWSNADPGGFEAGSLSVPRDLPQTIRGLPVRIDTGLRVAWEGRVSQVQRSLGARTQINCEGYGARLKDQSGSMVFVDRDFTRWNGPTIQRQISLASSNSVQSPQPGADPISGNPSLVSTITGPWNTAPGPPDIEGWYDAGAGNLIGSIYYAWTRGANALNTDTNWTWDVLLCSDDVASVLDSSGNLRAAGPGTGTLTATGSRRFAATQFFYANVAGGDSRSYQIFWNQLAVYGNHGLTGRGSNPVGFYPSDIASWVEQQVPGVQAGVIQQTDASNYIVAHSAYYSPVTLDQIVADMSKAQGWHWGVWESLSPLTGSALPRLDFRPRPAAGAFTAYCRRSACATLDMREDLSGQYNSATVTFNQVDGTQGVVTVTADNPILDQAGIGNRTVILNGGLMTPAAAAIFGAEALTILNQQARVAGTASIIQAIDGPSGPTAPWLLKAGIDRLRIGDLPSTDAFGAYSDMPISRVECSVSSSGIVTDVELGTGAQLIETLQARLAAATTLSGAGGG